MRCTSHRGERSLGEAQLQGLQELQERLEVQQVQKLQGLQELQELQEPRHLGHGPSPLFLLHSPGRKMRYCIELGPTCCRAKEGSGRRRSERRNVVAPCRPRPNMERDRCSSTRHRCSSTLHHYSGTLQGCGL